MCFTPRIAGIVIGTLVGAALLLLCLSYVVSICCDTDDRSSTGSRKSSRSSSSSSDKTVSFLRYNKCRLIAEQARNLFLLWVETLAVLTKRSRSCCSGVKLPVFCNSLTHTFDDYYYITDCVDSFAQRGQLFHRYYYPDNYYR